MRFIIDCEPEALVDVARLMQRELPTHQRHGWPRPGWGWHHWLPERGIKVFVRDTKLGLSAKTSTPVPPQPAPSEET